MVDMDYSKLKGRMTEKGFTIQTLASSIGITNNHLGLKLKNKYAFTQSEIEKICAALDIDIKTVSDYFFARKVEKTQQ